MKLRNLTMLGLFVLGLGACSQDSDPNGESALDRNLSEVLLQASNGVGKSHFILPDSDDFANIPQDPKNPITAEKVALGKMLFHETGLALNPENNISLGSYSCASCHHAAAGFQAGIPQGIGEGGWGFGLIGEGRQVNPDYTDMNQLDVQDVKSPSSLNIAYQTNVLWNGQFGATGVNVGTEAAWTPGTPKEVNNLGYEGTEIQAIAAQDVHRQQVVGSLLETNQEYVNLFNAAFPNWPTDERISQETAGLAMAAFERTTLANEAPFQRWLKGENNAMTELQKEGAILFFGKAECGSCHSGPALNSMAFYGLGMKDLYERGDVHKADINSVGNKGRGGFTGRTEDMYKFKVPQLYNLKDSPFYGHGSSFTSIEEVIRYKNEGVPENMNVPTSQLASQFKPLKLTESEVMALKEFIENGLYDANLQRYVPSTLPSGQCFPNADEQSKTDMGCD